MISNSEGRSFKFQGGTATLDASGTCTVSWDCCGGDDSTGDGPVDTVGEQPGLRAPTPIQITGGGDAAGNLAAAASEDAPASGAASSDMMIAPAYWVSEYVVGDDMPALPVDGTGYVFDATPEEKQDALSRLDALMARWEDDGVETGYTVEDGPDDDTITGDSGIDQKYVRAVFLNLAVEIAPSYGKQVMPQTLRAAAEAYTRARSGQTPPTKNVNTTAVPAGAGHKYYRPETITLPGADE